MSEEQPAASEYDPSESEAAELVPEILEAVDRETSQQFEDRAKELASDAELNSTISRSPSGIAAGAVYATGLLVNEKVHQDDLSEAADVHTTTIRKAYNDILDHEGVATTERRETTTRATTTRDDAGLVSRLRRLFDA